MPEKYIIDGKEYDRYEDIPEQDRALLDAKLKILEDKDGDGTPDIFQAFKGGGETFSVTRSSRVQTEIRGKGEDRVIRTTTSAPGNDGSADLNHLIARATGRGRNADQQRSRFDRLVIAFLIVLVAVLVLDRFQLLPQL